MEKIVSRRKMPRILELFSGTGSIGRAFAALGWEVISVDLDPRANATYCCDVSTWDHSCVSDIDVIWGFASVHFLFPCTLQRSQK